MTGTPPRSRRDRPAKPPLSKTWIVDTAIRILQEHGLEQVTMRRVAQALDTGPASLYVYIANTVDLHAELLDRLLIDLTPPNQGTWEERLIQYLASYEDVLSRSSGLARSALTTRPSGPNYLRVHETTASLLLQGNLPPASAVWGADLLVLLVTASAAEHAPPAPDQQNIHHVSDASATSYLEHLRAQLTQTSAFPVFSAHLDTAFGGTPQQRQRWQLQVVLAGLARTPVPITAQEPLRHD